jgi:hypothetical protein
VRSGTAYYYCTIAKSDILSVKRRAAAADQTFTTVLREAVEAVSQAGYPFLVLGGLASALVGRPRWTHDIDFLVRPDDARDILEVFAHLMAEAVDNAGADLVVHGHAHHGSEKGRTPGGIPVRNVAQPLIRHAYNIYTLNGHREVLAAVAGGIS